MTLHDTYKKLENDCFNPLTVDPNPSLDLNHFSLILRLENTYLLTYVERRRPKVIDCLDLGRSLYQWRYGKERGDEGRRIREAFIAPPGSTLLSADYSQIELRIMAHISGDESLLRAFATGEDIHRATAAEIFSTERNLITSEQRRYAKVINFGLIYGMSAFG